MSADSPPSADTVSIRLDLVHKLFKEHPWVLELARTHADNVYPLQTTPKNHGPTPSSVLTTTSSLDATSHVSQAPMPLEGRPLIMPADIHIDPLKNLGQSSMTTHMSMENPTPMTHGAHVWSNSSVSGKHTYLGPTFSSDPSMSHTPSQGHVLLEPTLSSASTKCHTPAPSLSHGVTTTPVSVVHSSHLGPTPLLATSHMPTSFPQGGTNTSDPTIPKQHILQVPTTPLVSAPCFTNPLDPANNTTVLPPKAQESRSIPATSTEISQQGQTCLPQESATTLYNLQGPTCSLVSTTNLTPKPCLSQGGTTTLPTLQGPTFTLNPATQLTATPYLSQEPTFNLVSAPQSTPALFLSHGGTTPLDSILTHTAPNSAGPLDSILHPLSSNLDIMGLVRQSYAQVPHASHGFQQGPSMTPKKSYAQVTSGKVYSSDINIAMPVKKGEFFSVSIDEEIYAKRVSLCVNTLIGRLVYAKKDKPLSLHAFKLKLETMWGVAHSWKLIPLGKGYYNIHFSSDSEKDRVFKKKSWFVDPGIFHLSRWTPDFNPYKRNSSLAQVWVRIYELSYEYWDPSVILGIAHAIGNPITIDEKSLDGSMGHFVRVMVEVDLKNPLQEQVLVERRGHCSSVSIHYEYLPDFCVNCSIVGHTISICRNTSSTLGNAGRPQDNIGPKAALKQIYRPINPAVQIAASTSSQKESMANLAASSDLPSQNPMFNVDTTTTSKFHQIDTSYTPVEDVCSEVTPVPSQVPKSTYLPSCNSTPAPYAVPPLMLTSSMVTTSNRFTALSEEDAESNVFSVTDPIHPFGMHIPPLSVDTSHLAGTTILVPLNDTLPRLPNTLSHRDSPPPAPSTKELPVEEDSHTSVDSPLQDLSPVSSDIPPLVSDSTNVSLDIQSHAPLEVDWTAVKTSLRDRCPMDITSMTNSSSIPLQDPEIPPTSFVPDVDPAVPPVGNNKARNPPRLPRRGTFSDDLQQKMDKLNNTSVHPINIRSHDTDMAQQIMRAASTQSWADLDVMSEHSQDSAFPSTSFSSKSSFKKGFLMKR